MSLARCDTSGPVRVVETEPFLETRHDALFVPARGRWAEKGWGIYDAADRLVVAAARWTGDDPSSGTLTAPADAIAAAEPPADPDRVHVYAGLLDADDTFFLDTLARFWGRATSGVGGTRLVFHARDSLERFWTAPHVAEALAAFGLGPDDCLVPATPCRIPHLLVPAPSFVSGRLAHRAFGRVMATLGLRLAGERATAPDPGAPVHVSHARETTPAFAGETAFDAALDAAGFAILHPGELSLAALAQHLAGAPLVTSTRPGNGRLAPVDVLCGLAPGRSRITLTPDGRVPLDARLIDATSGHQTLELAPADPSTDAPTLAAALIRAATRAITVWNLPCRLHVPAPVELGAVVAAATSCIEAVEGNPAAVLGGFITGRAQLRTAWRQRPWWQADWEIEVELTQVRVHLPVAGRDEVPGWVRLLGSPDGIDWHVLAQSRTAADVAAPAEPLIFKPRPDEAAWRLRVLRVQAMHDGVLALDQVEITGAPVIDLYAGERAA